MKVFKVVLPPRTQKKEAVPDIFGPLVFPEAQADAQASEKTYRDIEAAAAKRTCLRVVYRTHTKGVRRLCVEPYSYRNGALMAFDTEAGHIKRLLLRGSIEEGVVATEVTTLAFVPRWPIEIGGTPALSGIGTA